MHLEMSFYLTLVLVLDLDLDQAIQSMWRPPYKAIKCWSADEEILSKCLECRQGCKKNLGSLLMQEFYGSAQKINPEKLTSSLSPI